MVIDSSALIAVLLHEPESEALLLAIASDNRRVMSAVSFLETAIVIEARKGEQGANELDLFLIKADISIHEYCPEQAKLSRMAWRKFGKGRHPAALNFGDCCSYALAAHTGDPLLFKGNDFSKTDVDTVSY